jgi:hypothetical protein
MFFPSFTFLSLFSLSPFFYCFLDLLRKSVYFLPLILSLAFILCPSPPSLHFLLLPQQYAAARLTTGPPCFISSLIQLAGSIDNVACLSTVCIDDDPAYPLSAADKQNGAHNISSRSP